MKAPLTVSMEVSKIEALRARSKDEGTTPSRIVQDLVDGLLEGKPGKPASSPTLFSRVSLLREEAKSVGELAAESGLTPPEVESCLAELMADGILGIYLRGDGAMAYFRKPGTNKSNTNR